MVRRLKLLVLGFALIGCLTAALPHAATAAEIDVFKQACDGANQANQAGKGSEFCTTTGADPITGSGGTLAKATKLISYLSGIAAIILLVVAGIQYATSQGDPSKIGAAKNTVIYALVGLFVVVLAQSIVVFVLNRI